MPPLGMRGSSRVAHSRQASVSSCASTSVISLTFSGVKPSRYSAQMSHTGRPIWVVPSFSFTSNSPYMAGSMSGLNSERSYTLPGFFDSSSRRRERSWSK